MRYEMVIGRTRDDAEETTRPDGEGERWFPFWSRISREGQCMRPEIDMSFPRDGR